MRFRKGRSIDPCSHKGRSSLHGRVRKKLSESLDALELLSLWGKLAAVRRLSVRPSPSSSFGRCTHLPAVPQFVLDEEIQAKRGSQTTIIITQPRRVSAIGVASRVSAERAEDGSVGYAIRGESKTS